MVMQAFQKRALQLYFKYYCVAGVTKRKKRKKNTNNIWNTIVKLFMKHPIYLAINMNIWRMTFQMPEECEET
jgi:hypothetical protein